MQQEHLQLVISKTNSTGDERTMPSTLLTVHTCCNLPNAGFNKALLKEKHLRHFKLTKTKCICITEQQWGIELAVKWTDWIA